MSVGAEQPTHLSIDNEHARKHVRRFRTAFALLAIPAILFLVARRMLDVEMQRREGASLYTLSEASAVLPAVSGLCCLVSAWLIGTARVGIFRAVAILPIVLGLILLGATWDAVASRVLVGADRLVLPARGFPFREHENLLLEQIDAAVVNQGSETMEFLMSDGSTVTVPVGALLREALSDCSAALEARDIPVVGFE